MLTIARNLALGYGMSTAEGTIPTNGTQPLCTLLYAVLAWLVDADKMWGVILVQLLGFVVATVSAYLVFQLGRALFEAEPSRDAIASTAAVIWYAAPVTARHTQNCLETGAYVLVVIAIALYILRRLPAVGAPGATRRCAALGVMLALAFWVRNDAVLLAGAVCLSRLLSGWYSAGPGVARRVLESGWIGTCALVGALPWLIYNLTSFGSIVPISAISESTGVVIGENLTRLPAPLAEYLTVVLLIPRALEEHAPVMIGSVLLLIAWLWNGARLVARLGARARRWLGVLALWAALLCIFYGLFFGAGYFMSRYLFPLGPFLAIISVKLAGEAWSRLLAGRGRFVHVLVSVLALVLIVGLHVRTFVLGTNNGHFQVVEWVQEHVSDDVWVAAVQTGTLGYFHDRTLNLDGKVNPEALASRLAGRTLAYVAESPAQYIVDWAGIETWLDDPMLAPYFEILLLDESRNLAVLSRISGESSVPEPGSKGDERPGD